MRYLKNRNRWFVLLLTITIIIMVLVPSTIYAAEPPEDLLVGQPQALEDPAGTATIAQILETPERFSDLTTTAPNWGFSDSVYWLRIPVQNVHDSAQTFYLNLENPLTKVVDLYVVKANQVSTSSRSGAHVPISQRPYKAITFVLPFTLQANEAGELYVRIQAGATTLTPFALLDEAELEARVALNLIFNSIVIGGLCALLIYNLLLATLLRSRLYLYYVLLLFFGINSVAALTGFGPVYLYPNNTWLGSEGLLPMGALLLTLMIAFAYEFLSLQSHYWLNRVALILITLGIFVSVGVVIWPTLPSYMLVSLMAYIYPIFCFTTGILSWRQGKTEARFFLFGQLSSWSATIIVTLISMDLIPYQPLLFNSPAFGGLIDAFIFMTALADRIRILQRNNLAAEERARRNLEIRSEELERLVAERTAEIKTLHGILPICANCKKIRDDDGAWQQLEAYISRHTDAEFSHGICMECMEELYPEIYRKRLMSGS